MGRGASLWLAYLISLAPAVSAGTIDTDFLQRPWPKQRVRTYEVGRAEVRWRQQASKAEGVFAGVRFQVPLPRQQAWDLSSDFSDIGQMTPGVTSVRFLEQTPTRQVIQIDVKVLWKTLRLKFEVEEEPPKVMRFRLVNQVIGEYRGVCVFEASAMRQGSASQEEETTIELSTWLKPARPIPMGWLLFVERMTMLNGIRKFLASCEAHRAPAHRQDR